MSGLHTVAHQHTEGPPDSDEAPGNGNYGRGMATGSVTRERLEQWLEPSASRAWSLMFRSKHRERCGQRVAVVTGGGGGIGAAIGPSSAAAAGSSHRRPPSDARRPPSASRIGGRPPPVASWRRVAQPGPRSVSGDEARRCEACSGTGRGARWTRTPSSNVAGSPARFLRQGHRGRLAGGARNTTSGGYLNVSTPPCPSWPPPDAASSSASPQARGGALPGAGA